MHNRMDVTASALRFGCAVMLFVTVVLGQSTEGDQICGKPQVAPSKGFRIVGGGPAAANAWPWACALVQEVTKKDSPKTYRQFCDCTLIDKEWVVTAAHCLEGLTPAQFNYYVKVYIGVEDLTKAMYNQSNKYNISQTIKHEGFVMKTKNNDITLIKLARPVEKFDNDTMPACLPTRHVAAGDYVQKGPTTNRKVCYVGGWGHTYEGESGKKGFVGSGTDKIKQTSTEIMGQTLCKSKLPITDSMFCAGYDQGGRDTCQGDSGGPLVCDDGDGTWVLHGIVSWGPGCARANSPGVYTNVYYMKDWIKKHTGKEFSHIAGSSGSETDAAAPETTPLYEGRLDGNDLPIAE